MKKKLDELDDDEIISKNVIEIYNTLKKDLSVVKCDDKQCDDEDCVLYRAVLQYIKYNREFLKK